MNTFGLRVRAIATSRSLSCPWLRVAVFRFIRSFNPTSSRQDSASSLRMEFFRTELKNQDELKFQDIHSETAHSHHLLPARCISDNWNRDDLIKILYNIYKTKIE